MLFSDFLGIVIIVPTFDHFQFQGQKCLSQYNVQVPIRLKFKRYAFFLFEVVG